jgi:hypothetical protein
MEKILITLREWKTKREKLEILARYTDPDSVQQLELDNAKDHISLLEAQLQELENSEPDWDNLAKQWEDDRIWADSQP